MKLTDRQGKVAVVIDSPMGCDNCLLCPCLTQTMSVQCPPGVVGGHVEQALSLLKPTYIIKDKEGEQANGHAKTNGNYKNGGAVRNGSSTKLHAL